MGRSLPLQDKTWATEDPTVAAEGPTDKQASDALTDRSVLERVLAQVSGAVSGPNKRKCPPA